MVATARRGKMGSAWSWSWDHSRADAGSKVHARHERKDARAGAEKPLTSRNTVVGFNRLDAAARGGVSRGAR